MYALDAVHMGEQAYDDSMRKLRSALIWPTKYAAAGKRLGLSWSHGVLVHGPPGVGKTHLLAVRSSTFLRMSRIKIVSVLLSHVSIRCRPVQRVISEHGGVVHNMSAASLADTASGFAESHPCGTQLGAHTGAALRESLLLIDDLDTLLPSRNAPRSLARLTAQLLALLDAIATAGGATWCVPHHRFH